MDRFFYYLLGGMAAAIVVALLFSRHKDAADAPERTLPFVKATSPTPRRRLRSQSSSRRPPSFHVASSGAGARAHADSLGTAELRQGRHHRLSRLHDRLFLTLGNPLAVQYSMVNGAKPRRWPEPVRVKTPDGRQIPAAGYARGQMALESSIATYFGKAAGANTSLMPNICAFAPACLAGPWAEFSELEPKWAGTFGWIEVVAGPVFSSPPAQVGGLLIPRLFTAPTSILRRQHRFSHSAERDFDKARELSHEHLDHRGRDRHVDLPNTIPVDQRDIAAKAVW